MWQNSAEYQQNLAKYDEPPAKYGDVWRKKAKFRQNLGEKWRNFAICDEVGSGGGP